MADNIIFQLYDEISDFFNLGPVSSVEFKDPSAAKKYLIKQLSTANRVGKMSDIYAMALHESILTFGGDAADIYQATQAESYRLVHVLGIPAPINYDKWLFFLSTAEEAALAAKERGETATWANVIKEASKQTADDLGDLADKAKDAADPRKSPWPFVIGGTLLLILLRR